MTALTGTGAGAEEAVAGTTAPPTEGCGTEEGAEGATAGATE